LEEVKWPRRLLPRARRGRGALPGVAFQAVETGERGYPPDQIELFSEVHLRGELDLGDDDPIACSSDLGLDPRSRV
jgi:hypothetical protein